MNAQRKQQIMRLVCVAMLGLIFSHTADAHRLDEYLQASQISIESGRIIVEINLTPGAAVADGVIAEIDRDADGELSPSESAAYAGVVVRSLSLEVDGGQRPLVLERYRFPSPAAMRKVEDRARFSAFRSRRQIPCASVCALRPAPDQWLLMSHPAATRCSSHGPRSCRCRTRCCRTACRRTRWASTWASSISSSSFRKSSPRLVLAG